MPQQLGALQGSTPSQLAGRRKRWAGAGSCKDAAAAAAHVPGHRQDRLLHRPHGVVAAIKRRRQAWCRARQ